MGRLIMRRIMPVKHVRLGIPIDLPFCLRFDEFSYIAINNHLTSVAFPGIITRTEMFIFLHRVYYRMFCAYNFIEPYGNAHIVLRSS